MKIAHIYTIMNFKKFLVLKVLVRLFTYKKNIYKIFIYMFCILSVIRNYYKAFNVLKVIKLTHVFCNLCLGLSKLKENYTKIFVYESFMIEQSRMKYF